ncbi:MAG: TonB-dependent receptor plug domain-containing protein, partial [Prevotella sp.]|nr:TonB-dependent receptor plug domain-containing protein [Prevotella sp.]
MLITKSLQKPLALLFLLCFLPMGAMAQGLVKGIVNDETGEPVVGATVKVDGTNAGTITDLDGNFIIEAASNATLSISYVGYVTQQVNVAGRSNIQITLVEDNTTLNDVVVIGYGTMKKKLVTGATVQVKGEDIAKMNTTNALEAMQSMTPGVQITQSSAQPGKGYKVYIRGIGTNGDASPLYVIDGVAGGSLDDINPADIESIDILKDAASAAIYGSRAANGVILVTT